MEGECNELIKVNGPASLPVAFQSLFLWRENATFYAILILLCQSNVSILVFMEGECNVTIPPRIWEIYKQFQSLFLWRENATSLAFSNTTHSYSIRFNPCFYGGRMQLLEKRNLDASSNVSILVFMEGECNGGQNLVYSIYLLTFQSLFLWRENATTYELSGALICYNVSILVFMEGECNEEIAKKVAGIE